MSKWMLSTAGAMLFSSVFLAAPAPASADPGDPQVYMRFGSPSRHMHMRRAPRRGWRGGRYRWNGRRYVWVGGRHDRWRADRWDRGRRRSRWW